MLWRDSGAFGRAYKQPLFSCGGGGSRDRMQQGGNAVDPRGCPPRDDAVAWVHLEGRFMGEKRPPLYRYKRGFVKILILCGFVRFFIYL